MYQVSFEYLEWFVSYGPRFKFLDDEDDEHADAKAMTITRLFFLQKTDELKRLSVLYFFIRIRGITQLHVL